MNDSEEEFERLVQEGIQLIPEKFLKLLDNVAITIADQPTAEQKTKMQLRGGKYLLGLYEGIPLTRRQNYGVGSTMPDRITIFCNPIVEVCGGDPERVKQQVAQTVWHEIAHHFGMDEHAVRTTERKRRRKKMGSATIS